MVAYDASWPDEFHRERLLLAETLGEWIVAEIEHVGSTAVPGLAAKPVIDVMAPVAGLEESKPAIAAAVSVGYEYHPYRADVMHWHCKYVGDKTPRHLHLVPYESPLWHDRLVFRDALRANSDFAAEYAELKLRLARKHRHERDAYTNAKTPFVERVLADHR